MADELEYVVHGALMVCDKGTAPGFFNPTYNAKTKVGGCLVTTAMDKLPITNIPSFTVCSISQKPCIPVPTEWENTYKVKVQGQDTLLARSCMKCGLGGKIEFVTSGQVPLPQDALDDIKAMQEAGAEPEEDDGLSWWDAAELIPVIGSGIGIVREAKKGHWLMAAANVGFLISDIAGVVSFGATTAASTAGKTALKGGTKIAAKSASKAAAKKVGKSGLKTALKLTAKGAKEKFKKSIDDIIKYVRKGKKSVTARKRIFQKKKTWTANHPRGTKQTYQIVQRSDIDWNKVRTAGDKRFIGKTNAEAAKNGLPPQLSDGNFATLHHIGQDGRGPLVEASTRYHGVGKKPGQDILHSQYGKNKPNPNYPVDRKAFANDTKEYWKYRVNNK